MKQFNRKPILLWNLAQSCPTNHILCDIILGYISNILYDDVIVANWVKTMLNIVYIISFHLLYISINLHYPFIWQCYTWSFRMPWFTTQHVRFERQSFLSLAQLGQDEVSIVEPALTSANASSAVVYYVLAI